MLEHIQQICPSCCKITEGEREEVTMSYRISGVGLHVASMHISVDALPADGIQVTLRGKHTKVYGRYVVSKKAVDI